MGPCCVEGCMVTSEHTYYFEFPTSRLLRRKWLEVIPIQGKLPLGTLVCSRHFSADDYQNVRGKVRLKRKVVPSLLLDEMKTSNKDKISPKSPPKVIDNCDSTTVSVPSPVDGDKVVETIQNQKQCDIGVNAKVSTEFAEICKVVRKENGWSGDSNRIRAKSPILPDPKEDIEDMITNYHIKNKLPNVALLPDIVPLESEIIPVESEVVPVERQMEDPIEIEDGNDVAPVFIEISVDKDTSATENQDCLMLLESVQVEVDPTTLMLDQDYDHEDDKAPDKRDDPISLLTSSDEDEVIIQEPHIDTVEVSDATDEDDMPLVKLVKKKPKKKKSRKSPRKNLNSKQKEQLEKSMWGMFDFYCVQCHFTTKNRLEYNSHISEHSKVLRVCPICEFTSASKSMYSRHIRKHKEEKKFKCHLCKYRSRHNMSLIYHLKCHDTSNFSKPNKGFTCEKCSFKSYDKDMVVMHLRSCNLGVKSHACDKCDYQTNRRCDLIRHTMRKHKDYKADTEYVLEA